jgi:hypothetical protein
MSNKHLLNKTKRDFVDWLKCQDDKLWYDMVTTGFTENTELAKFRRLYVKIMNDRNLRELKDNAS